MANMEYLKKIYALAVGGFGGEQENAKIILDKLLKKYSMSIEQLQEECDEEKNIKIDVKTPTKYEGKILSQVVYKVINEKGHCYDLYRKGKKIPKVVRVHCTAREEIEIRFLYDFYRMLWFEEVEFFLEAFIQKHELFGTNFDENGEQVFDTISEEEYIRLRSAMNALRNKSPLLQIEEGKQ